MPKKVWITGASSGIGKALAIKFANDCATIVVQQKGVTTIR